MQKIIVFSLSLVLLASVLFSSSSAAQSGTPTPATPTTTCTATADQPNSGGVIVTDAAGFQSDAFRLVWERTDKLVASGAVQRSYYWGPKAGVPLREPFGECGNKRMVQYFDKSRMEVNNPAADPTSKFYVTNGLLTTELVSGRMQIGPDKYEQRSPANIPLASDPDDATAPTYASFSKLTAKTASRVDGYLSDYITRDGRVYQPMTDQLEYPVTLTTYISETGHNIAAPIWDFLNQRGSVLSGTVMTTEQLSDPWFYASGYPISEPYWARVRIGGVGTLVLIQLFERRVVTFVPTERAAYRVQMGNIGQHYYDWRYKGAGNNPTAGTQETPAPPSGQQVPTPTSGPPPASGYVEGTMPLTASVAKANISAGETQTIAGTTLPGSHVYMICLSTSGFPSDACPKGDKALNVVADAGGNYALTWTLAATNKTRGLTAVLIKANNDQEHKGATYKTNFTIN